MRNLRIFLTLLCLGGMGLAQAQNLVWDKERYPDLPDPNPKNVDLRAYEQMKRRMKARRAEGQVRPDHLNNALNPSFPPVINQSGGSCGSASSIWYQFTNQINSARYLSAATEENQYPTHWTWLLTNAGVGYTEVGQVLGIPNVQTYGGKTYSNLFGSQVTDNDNFGWMQGYDKWFHAMHNRILRGNSFPMSVATEEGRELVKNYLWNRCGEDGFASGGVCGVGVAAFGEWGRIPKTEANDDLGVTGMYYVGEWGEQYNHALTIVGYDDRIEFDLDSNGVVGEKDKDEIGAWIIANSWGNGWCNGGFIYCPYAKANHVKGWTTFFTPGYFDVIRDYSPVRTLRVRMEYDHRSEMALYVGVAQDTTATKPEKSMALRHFQYCGDGNGGKTNPAPAVPMLGKWADGLHYEPMEFGYDLTDLTRDFDATRPLKYFFWVETRSWAIGSGKVHEVSIIDYTLDQNGVEVPFETGEYVDVPSAGAKTELTAVVYGEALPAPANPAISGQTLTWQKPVGTLYAVSTYKVYKDGELLHSVDGGTLASTIDGSGCYTVSATYTVGGRDVESKVSDAVSPAVEPLAEQTNDILYMKAGSQLTIPDVSTGPMSDFTLEFWLRPRATSGEAFGIKAMKNGGSCSFFFKIDGDNKIQIGHDGGDYTTSTKKVTLSKNWHIAIVSEGLATRVYVNGEQYINWTSGYGHSGLDLPSDLIFGMTEGTTSNYKKFYTAGWLGWVDEIRFWDCARTQEQIRTCYTDAVANPSLYPNLTHCYHMDQRTDEDGSVYLLDAKGGHHALITGGEKAFEFQNVALGDKTCLLQPAARADFALNTSVVTGQPVRVTDLSGPGIIHWQWDVTGAETSQFQDVAAPILVFNQAGKQTVTLKTTNLYGQTAEKTVEVDVQKASLSTVDFIMPEVVTLGEHVTFINTTAPLDAATYEWHIEGAQIPVVKTVHAGATFTSYGTYKVRLTAHVGGETRSAEKLVTIEKIAPVAAFSIYDNILLRGQKAYFVNESKYDPDELKWQISSGYNDYIIHGGHTSVTFDEPGVYDVKLTATNDRGAHSITRNRGVIVCNADGDRGLFFDGADNVVTTASPFGEEQVKEFSIEWWMYPGRLRNNCERIGDEASTFMLQTREDGTMQFLIGGRTAATAAGYVIADEWHHYAVTYKSGTVVFYRDGVKITSKSSGVSALPVLSKFELGSSTIPMNALVDELRVWKSVLTEEDIFANSNAPLENPAALENLLLYYDFNQSTGDVQDKSAQGLTGRRVGFGPDGDAWTETLGIFFLNEKKEGVDVTATYMKNFKHPFTTASGYVNGTTRFQRLLMNTTRSPWKQENSVVANNITTQFYVDSSKGYFLCLETTWSGFASSVKDLKLYQTVTLPAGAYQFSANAEGREWENEGTYNVVAKGAGLPDTEDLATGAIDFGLAGDKCVFILDEETEVSLGCVSNMSGQKCLAIGNFSLVQKNTIVTDANGEVPTGVENVPVSVQPSLQVRGGLGCIMISAPEPQHVVVADLAGKVLFREWVDSSCRIPAPRGIYVVNHKKVMVK